jgi:hypothetical protein
MTIHEQLGRLRMIMSVAPSGLLMEEVERICSGENACKLFWCERVEDPEWFPLMVSRNWFAKAPNILREAEMIVQPGWPEAMILLRFAKVIPAQVAAVIAAFPQCDNPRVGDQIIRIAAELQSPEDIRAVQHRVAAVLTDGTRSSRLWLLEMLCSWLALGASQEVMTLLPVVLHSGGSEKRLATQARDSWEVSRLDEQVLAPLTPSHGRDLAALLCETLANFEGGERQDEFSSTLWLEDFSGIRGFSHQTETILALRLYAVCRDLVTREHDRGAVFVDGLLRRQQAALLRRLRWQLYSDFPEYYLQQAHDDVLQRIPEMSHLRHTFELQNMIASFVTHYGNRFLSATELSLVVESIRRGPLDDTGAIVDDETYAQRFRAKQIEPFRPLLEDKELFAIRSSGGNQIVFTPEDYKPLRGGGDVHVIEQRSPISPQELAAMDDAELWPLLNGWMPDPTRTGSEWWIEEDVAGLARAFGEATYLEPRRFSPESEWWTHLTRPEFFWHILDDALSSEKGSPPNEHAWETWIGMSEFVVAQTPIEHTGEDSGADDTSGNHPTWKYARWSVARVLERILKHEKSPPIKYGQRIRALLERLLRDDDPRLEQIEKSWSSSSFDWLSKGINSAAGTAIEVLFSFARWHQEHSLGSDAIAWIPVVLKEQLMKEEQSPAVFAVLGSQLALLVHLFPEWAKENNAIVLPFEHRPEHARACLIAHISYNNPNGIVIGAFPHLPDHALELNQSDIDERQTTFQSEIPFRVGYHLAFYYWNGLPDHAVAAQRLERFFETAPAGTRGRLIAQIGHVFRGAASRAASTELLDRVKLLWDRRFAIISAAVRRDPTVRGMFALELESFSEWIEDDCFEADWRLSRFAEALKFVDKAPATVDLAEALEKLSADPHNLPGVMRCVQLLTEKLADSFRWSMREGDLKNTIKRGLETPDVATRTIAEIARDNLLRQGLFEYQEV